jgi:rRNA biogenesis protein RRP5
MGFSLLDGLLQLSLKPSVIEQKYLRPTDLTVGEIIKGTVKNLSDLGLFVAISNEVDGVVWPLHYSDIKLKNPERKFKVGNSVKCRVSLYLPTSLPSRGTLTVACDQVFNVDEERNRVTLTLKKSLIDSELSILTRLEDAKIGLVTPGVVAKILPKSVIINYFGGLRGTVSLREARHVHNDILFLSQTSY